MNKQKDVPVFDKDGNQIGIGTIVITEKGQEIIATIDIDEYNKLFPPQKTISHGFKTISKNDRI